MKPKLDVRDNVLLKAFEKVPCLHCGDFKTYKGYDGCLGTLNGVMNACCGHGITKDAFVQFYGGYIISGEDAVIIQTVLKRNRIATTNLEKLVFLAGSCKFVAEELEVETK